MVVNAYLKNNPMRNTVLTATLPGGNCDLGQKKIMLLFWLPWGVRAQAPVISYSGPQTYFINQAITPAAPINTGGVVAPPGYNPTPVIFSSGFNYPIDLVFDAAGNLYVDDYGNKLVYKIPKGGGTPVTVGSTYESGVAVDGTGNVYVADYHAIKIFLLAVAPLLRYPWNFHLEKLL